MTIYTNMNVELSRKAEKQLDKLPISKRQKITDKLIFLKNDPSIGKKLSGKFSGCWSMRVWPYRVIYQINNWRKTILVITVEHRQGVYK